LNELDEVARRFSKTTEASYILIHSVSPHEREPAPSGDHRALEGTSTGGWDKEMDR